MNNKGIQIKSAFFAVIVAGMVIVAVGIIVGGWNQAYNSGLDNDLGEFSALTEFANEANRSQQELTPQTSETGDFEGRIFRSAFGFISRIFLPFEVIFNMFESLERRFSLPPFIGEGITTLIPGV